MVFLLRLAACFTLSFQKANYVLASYIFNVLILKGVAPISIGVVGSLPWGGHCFVGGPTTTPMVIHIEIIQLCLFYVTYVKPDLGLYTR